MNESARRFRLWPTSLTWQIVLVAALALLCAQMMNFALLLQGQSRMSETEAASLATARIAIALGNGVEYRQDTARSRRARGIARLPMRVVTSQETAPQGEIRDDFSERAAASLRELAPIGPVTATRVRIDTLPPVMKPLPRPNRHGARISDRSPLFTDAVLVRAQMPDGRIFEASAPIRPRESTTVGVLAMQTGILYLAVLLPLALFAWWVARPLHRLTEQARRFSGNGGEGALAEQGPSDVRRLIAAFNAMQGRVRSLLGEKDVMLGAIGHDLKTPLASFRLRLETLDLADEDEAERDRMVATVEEMHAMLDDILMLARLGRSSETVEQADPVALLSALAEDYANQGRAIRFAGDDSVRAKPVALRPLLVRRALRNLIENALIYGKDAELSLVRIADRVEFCVADSGPGVADADMESLFEPFRRAEASRSRSTGGTGLGLTIARAIARAHGGDVTLTNRETGGLLAIFSVPLR